MFVAWGSVIIDTFAGKLFFGPPIIILVLLVEPAEQPHRFKNAVKRFVIDFQSFHDGCRPRYRCSKESRERCFMIKSPAKFNQLFPLPMRIRMTWSPGAKSRSLLFQELENGRCQDGAERDCSSTSQTPIECVHAWCRPRLVSSPMVQRQI